MDFTEPAQQQRAREVFRAHPNLILLLRDGRSLEKARRAFPEVRSEFCPDLALGVGWLDRPSRPDHDAVLLMREDSELATRHEFAFPAHVTTLRRDWGFTGTAWLRWNAARIVPALVARSPAVIGPTAVDASLGLMARTSVATAMGVLSRGRVVVTDRLHAAVLAALMRIPVVVLDNSYGKISAAHDAYLHLIPGLRFASTDREAVDVALACLADQRQGG
jgi:pyruvyl transferase EpsO